MPKLPDQRGFYDDIRPFQRTDVKVRTEAFAPTRGQQLRKQLVWGLAMLVFLAVTAYLRVRFAKQEAGQTYRQPGYWTGVAKDVPAQPPPARTSGARD